MDNFLLGALAASLVIGAFAVIFIAKRQHAAGRPLPEPPAPRPAPVGTLSVVGGWIRCIECRGVYPPGSSTSEFRDDFCSGECQADWFAKRVWKENPKV